VPNGPTTTPARAVRTVGASGVVAAVPSSRPFPRRSRARRPAGSTTCARPRRKPGRSGPVSVPEKPGPASPGAGHPARTRIPATTSRSRATPRTGSRTTIRATAKAPGDGRRRRDSVPVPFRAPLKFRRVRCRPVLPRPVLPRPARIRPARFLRVRCRPVRRRPGRCRRGAVASGPVLVTRGPQGRGNVRAVCRRDRPRPVRCRPVRCRRVRSARVRCRPVEFRVGSTSRVAAGVVRDPPGSGPPAVLRPVVSLPAVLRPVLRCLVLLRPALPWVVPLHLALLWAVPLHLALRCPVRCRPVRVCLVRCRRVLAVVLPSRGVAALSARRRVAAAGRSRRIRPGRCSPGSRWWAGPSCRRPATRPRSR
jgi:hypothetical protein